jgi:hypothetical protein
LTENFVFEKFNALIISSIKFQKASKKVLCQNLVRSFFVRNFAVEIQKNISYSNHQTEKNNHEPKIAYEKILLFFYFSQTIAYRMLSDNNDCFEKSNQT